MDFKLDRTTNDIIWNNGPLTKEYTTQPFTETVAQRLKIRLLTFKEEWIFNTEYGPPYWQRVLGFKNNKSALDLLFQEEILKESGVKQLVTFTSTFVNRQYSFTFTVKVTSGDVTSPITIQPIG